jgi:hypothetical protein
MKERDYDAVGYPIAGGWRGRAMGKWLRYTGRNTRILMLDLLQNAHKAATSEGRRQLLDGLLDENERTVRRALEEDCDHGELLADEFFTPFIGLAAGLGSRDVWNVLSDYGYSFNSGVRDDRDDVRGGDSGMTLAQWCCGFLEPERLDQLIGWRLLKPFECGVGNKLCPAESGMLSGSAELFDYWVREWLINEVLEAAKKCRTEQPTLGMAAQGDHDHLWHERLGSQ